MAWEKYLKIVVDHTKVDADLTDFPLAIVLSASTGTDDADVTAIFDELGSNKYKIKIEDASNNQKYVEIDFWDSTGKVAVLHVKVDISSTADTVLRLYYDSSQADNTSYVGVTGETAALNVWDANFVGVYHLSQNPSGGSGAIKDSTSNANHGTAYGSMTSGDLVETPLGGGIDFDGTNDYINIGNDSSLEIGSDNFTIESIFKTSIQNDFLVIASKRNINYDGFWSFRVESANTLNLYGKNASGTSFNLSNTTTLASGTVYYGAAVLTDSVGRTYVNGSYSQTSHSAEMTFNRSGVDALIGTKAENDLSQDLFNGILSEVRLSNCDRSDAWIKATYYALTNSLLAFCNFKVAGTVKEGATNIARTVRVYNRATGAILGIIISSATDGSFEITLSTNEDIQVVALDDDAGTDFNDLIYRTTPVEG